MKANTIANNTTNNSMQFLTRKLSDTQQSYEQLATNFQHNLHAIQELEEENTALQKEIEKIEKIYQIQIQSVCLGLKKSHEEEMENIKKSYNQYAEEMEKKKQKQIEEILDAVMIKHKKEINLLKEKCFLESKLLKEENQRYEASNKKLIGENGRHLDYIKQLKNQLLVYQEKMHKINQQKNAYGNKFALHQEELEGVRKSTQEWEEMLKNKLRQCQKEKQSVEDQYCQYKMEVKEKLKKNKDQNNKKIIHLLEEKQQEMRSLLHQNKQYKYKMDHALQQSKEKIFQFEQIKQEKLKIQNQLQKEKQKTLMKTSMQTTERQYAYMIKIHQENIKEFKNTIEFMNSEKKEMKKEMEEINQKRQHAEKGIERLKIALLDKNKENQQLKKQIKFVKRQRINERALMNENNLDRVLENGGNKYNSNQIQNSKAYTEDIGVVDDKFFESPSRSPANHQNSIHYNFVQNGQNNTKSITANNLKRQAQLQHENQQLKHLIQVMKNQMQNLNKFTQQDKELTSRSIEVYKNQINLYRDKINDKEFKIMNFNQKCYLLERENQLCRSQLKNYIDLDAKYNQRDKQCQENIKNNHSLTVALQQLQQQYKNILEERNLLQQISSELRAELNELKEIINISEENYVQQKSSYLEGPSVDRYLKHSLANGEEKVEEKFGNQVGRKNNSSKDKREKISQVNNSLSEAIHSKKDFNSIFTNQKIPRKLHDLVKQKKQFAISGKKANIQQKIQEIRPEHIGTESQKEIYEKIKIKNKTPPKSGVNFNDLRLRQQKRSNAIETESQKEVFERLRSRNNVQAESQNSRKGINYNDLKMKEQMQRTNEYFNRNEEDSEGEEAYQ